TIATAVKDFLTADKPIYVSGGGKHNPLLIQQLRNLLPGHPIEDASTLGIDPDAKEAIIFAILANECLFGQPDKYPLDASSYPNITMGKVSFPCSHLSWSWPGRIEPMGSWGLPSAWSSFE